MHREHPEELTYRCYLSVLAGFDKYHAIPDATCIVAHGYGCVKLAAIYVY